LLKGLYTSPPPPPVHFRFKKSHQIQTTFSKGICTSVLNQGEGKRVLYYEKFYINIYAPEKFECLNLFCFLCEFFS
jgi:hypothetical protein